MPSHEKKPAKQGRADHLVSKRENKKGESSIFVTATHKLQFVHAYPPQ